MVDRAACAGAAVGVGLLLICQQLFADAPEWAVIAVAVVLVVIGAVTWSDQREEHFGEGVHDDCKEIR